MAVPARAGCLHLDIDGQRVRLDAAGLEKALREIPDLGRKIAEATRQAHGLDETSARANTP